MGTEAALVGLEPLPVSQHVEPSQWSCLLALPAKPVSSLLPQAGGVRNEADRSSCSSGSSAAPTDCSAMPENPSLPLSVNALPL